MTMGCPAKGYKLTASRIVILRALVVHGPFEDNRGQAAKRLQAHTGHRRTQSLSSALEGLEAVGLVRRDTRGQRTYRIEAVLGPLTPSDLAALNLPLSSVAPIVASSEIRSSVYLTRSRVEVIRALLADGPIEDPTGHATRLLMERLGREWSGATRALLSGMARAGLIRRTVERGRVTGLAVTIDGLAPADQARIWSKTDFPVAKQCPVAAAGGNGNLTQASSNAAPVEDGEVAALRAELVAAQTELGRLRLQLAVFRAWANRMPTFGPLGPHSAEGAAMDAPPEQASVDPVAPSTGRGRAFVQIRVPGSRQGAQR